MVKLGDEIGKVDSIGLRFTVLLNLHGQRIIIPRGNTHMCVLSKNILSVLLILFVGLTFPAFSLSQDQNQTSASRIDGKNLTSDVGLATLDEIKERRVFVESSEDILEKDKKNDHRASIPQL